MGDKSPIREIERVFFEYSRSSTVHGVRYLCDKRRHWSERMWWIISVSTSIIMCAGFLFGCWSKWTISPLIITFADEATPISNIPFPTGNFPFIKTTIVVGVESESNVCVRLLSMQLLGSLSFPIFNLHFQ